ncbi:MAG: class I SAM-dependent methyltransferase [Deltaproteobacteria bacterium]|nr:class I SAM-dependent methyltransferase [Deltaproteobacteria bacterium]MBW2415779.1 class I SAM-dependent methyltransferase [Deltaproteobacteria bacterium]
MKFTAVLALGVVALLTPGLAVGESADLASALASPARAETDRARDAGRRPAEVVAFLGIEPGMTVMDVIAAGGYYTEVLSLAVGPKGRVYAQNPPIVLQFRDGANDKAMTGRLAKARLPNVVRLDQPLAEIELGDNSLDAAITALNFHDVYNRDSEAVAALLASLRRLLRPGGVLGLIDHVGAAGADNKKLHRIPPADAIAAAKSAGFTVEETDLLRNPEDDGSRSVFDPAIRGKTDRFLLRLRSPD